MSNYRVIVTPNTIEQEIKRSRFIACLEHTPSADAAKAFIKTKQIHYKDARHVCWAWIAGAPNASDCGMSDDGEPSGTAGKPILNVLQQQGIGEVSAVVIRYYGGIKLGTGGLSRAYSSSISLALEQAELIKKVPMAIIQLELNYSEESTVRHYLEQFNAKIEQVDYQSLVSIRCKIKAMDIDGLAEQLPFSVKYRVISL